MRPPWPLAGVALVALLLLPAVAAEGIVIMAVPGEGFRSPGKPIAVQVRASNETGPVPFLRITVEETGASAVTNEKGVALFSFREENATTMGRTFVAGPLFVRGRPTELEAPPTYVSLTWTGIAPSIEPAGRPVPPGADFPLAVSARFTVGDRPAAGLPFTVEGAGHVSEGRLDRDGRGNASLRSDETGVFDVTVTFHGKSLGLDEDTVAMTRLTWAVRLGPGEEAPKARLRPIPDQVLPGSPVPFDASPSEAATEVVAWAFDFGDGTPVQMADRPVVNHTYSFEGVHQGSLIVFDREGHASAPLPFTVLVAADRPADPTPPPSPDGHVATPFVPIPLLLTGILVLGALRRPCGRKR